MSWNTKITDTSENTILIQGYRCEDLIGNVGYPSTVYLLLRGELPSENAARMMDAILTSCVDHGPAPPSALAARTAASGGVELPSAIAAGVLAIGDAHGGAIEECARILQDARGEASARNRAPTEVQAIAIQVVSDLRDRRERMPGFGHRVHSSDPRATRLLSLATELGIAADHVAIAHAIEAALEQSLSKHLPMNVDGAIAAVISDMGFDWRLGKAFFVIGRVAGLAAHVHEELTTQKPMRKIATADAVYDGPAERRL